MIKKKLIISMEKMGRRYDDEEEVDQEETDYINGEDGEEV